MFQITEQAEKIIYKGDSKANGNLLNTDVAPNKK